MRDRDQHHSPRPSAGGRAAAHEGVAAVPDPADLDLVDFETVEAAIAEDRLRLERLGWVLPIEPPLGWTNIGATLALNNHRQAHPVPRVATPSFDRAAVLSLMEKLTAAIEGLDVVPSLASSVAMRTIRLQVIGALLAGLAGYTDDELCTVTILKPAWVLPPVDLTGASAKRIKRSFEQDLKRGGVTAKPGPLVAFLHGEFEPATGVFVVHWHVVTTREKADFLAKALKKLSKTYKVTEFLKRPVRRSQMRNRPRQVSYLLKAFWPQRTRRLVDGDRKRDRDIHRISEPWSAAYLLWLDRHRLADLTVMNGTWSPKKGGSAAWRRFYLLILGVGKTMPSGR